MSCRIWEIPQTPTQSASAIEFASGRAGNPNGVSSQTILKLPLLLSAMTYSMRTAVPAAVTMSMLPFEPTVS
jgi:hypothetical protein